MNILGSYSIQYYQISRNKPLRYRLGKHLPLQITKACSSLWQLWGLVLGSPQHITSPHKWAQGRLQAEILFEILSNYPII
jgi:hypothetical protein